MLCRAVITRTMIGVATVFASLACGGGGGGGPTGMPAANVVGHYSITHTGTLAGLGELASCPGELDITSQTGTSFSGTITITATEECQQLAGSGTISGTVTSGGALTFTITISNLEALLEAAGCEIVGGDPTFTGSAGTAGISAGRTISLRCDIEGGVLETDFEYTIAGPKT